MRRIICATLTMLLLVGCGGGDDTADATTAADAAAGGDAAAAPQAVTVGEFVVSPMADTEGALTGLTVRVADDADTVIWQTASARGFVAGGVGDETVSEQRGSFTFDDTIVVACDAPTFDTWAADGDGAVAGGGFEDCDRTWSLRFEAPVTGPGLAFHLTVHDLDDGTARSSNRAALYWASDAEEQLQGFGTQYVEGNLKGRRLPIWSQEQGIGRGAEPLTSTLNGVAPGSGGDWHTTYTAVPAFVTNRGRAMALENTEYLVFELEDDDVAGAAVWSAELRGVILAGASPAAQVEALTAYTGRMAPLAAWTQRGPIIRAWGGSDEVRRRVAELTTAGIAPAAVWIEDWAGSRVTPFGTRMWWNWEPDADIYADWPALIAELDAAGIAALIYINPFLADAAGKANATRNRFAEARDQGLLVTTHDGELFLVDQGGFDAGLLDLSNPDAVAYVAQILREQLDLGVDGWMADFGEALPYDATLASGASAAAEHNEYPRAWAQVSRDVAADAGRLDDVLFFSRSGNLRSPGTTRAFWVGDQTVSWDPFDGLQSVIPALVSSGLSGYSITHSDTAGFLSVSLGPLQVLRTEELFMRWAELNAFTPVLRHHTSNLPDENVQYDSTPEVLEHFVRMGRIFGAMADYRMAAMVEAEARGVPVIRHMALHHPDDPGAWTASQQFLLGADVLVAPVVTEGATERDVWLPAGRWVHLWTGAEAGDEAASSTVTASAPLGQPPMYYRAGSAAGAEVAAALDAAGLR